MSSSLSVIVPAHNEERFLDKCLDSIRRSAQQAGIPAEIIVALNRCTDRSREIAEAHGVTCVVDDRKCIAAIRNSGIRASSGEIVLTIDADSWMSRDSISDAVQHLEGYRFVGGGTMTVPERWSVGIIFSLLAIAPYLLRQRISGGMFWFRRETFEQIGGFDENLLSLEDLDFGLRLKAYGKARGQKYGTLRRGRIGTSCRKFDTFGDWYLFKNPCLVRRIFSGRDRSAVDHFYYNTDR